MTEISVYDILNRIIEEEPSNVWTKCINILLQTLKNNSNISKGVQKLTIESLQIESYLNDNDYKEIWKWMVNKYAYDGKYYRSQLLEEKYFKNYSLENEPRKFIRNIPTNVKRSIKYYLGTTNFRIGDKEKELINMCLFDFYNMCFEIYRPYSYELTPLVVLYTKYKNKLLFLPQLKQSELARIIEESSLPSDLADIIGKYLGTNQTAGKHRYKYKKTVKRKKHNTRRRRK